MTAVFKPGTELLFTAEDMNRAIEMFCVNLVQRCEDRHTAKQRAISDMTALIEAKVELVSVGALPVDWQAGQIMAHREALAAWTAEDVQ
ncbi:MAG: hypothetical protein LCI00_05450 [Chloroflexi bacterium]|nr:hypothetical protein [Chloroflexota bacterium]